MNLESVLDYSLWDYVVVPYLLVMWLGYSYFSKAKAKKEYCLASILAIHRVWWMQRMLKRENRVADSTLLANLERNVNFFASTTMIIIAALLTALSSAWQWQFVQQYQADVSNQYKVLLLLVIMVYAFFCFTWSLRQYGFGSVLLGAAPDPNQEELNATQRKEYAYSTAKVLDQAAHSFNYGLRAYYYALASISWFIHPLLFIMATSWVVFVLYRREFKSKPLRLMVMDVDILKEKTNLKP